MGVISKLKDLTQRTLVNSDIVSVQDSGGAGWYKTTLASLKNFIYIEIFGTANTWTAKNTFNAEVEVPTGTAGNDAVNFTQLELKQDIKSYVNYNDTTKAVTITGDSGNPALTLTEGQLNIAQEYSPSSSSESYGNINDMWFDRDYIYVKTTNGIGRVSLDFTW